MVVKLRRHRSRRRPNRKQAPVRLGLEALEIRFLPAATTWPGLSNPVAEVEPNDTLARAQDLGDFTTQRLAEIVGKVGNGPAGAADMDWYRFTLDAPAYIHISTLARQGGSSLNSVLSLYNSDDPFDFGDPYSLLFHH